jgi:signal transduction histidine kinase/response regulator of citrate/malate metabolism
MNFKLSGREQIVFYAMIALTIIALASTAMFHKQTTESMIEISHSNQAWNHYLELLSKLEGDAGNVNAPGNDVFSSHDVKRERERFRALQAQFDRDLGGLQQSMTKAVPGTDLSADHKALSDIGAIEGRMARSAEVIFEEFESGNLAGAAKTMAEMDQHYADLRTRLQQVRLDWAGVERGYAERQMATINALKNANAIVMAVNLLLILGLIISGYRIFQRFRESERALLDARNEAIRASQVKARFIANISHEIRTPMNGIIGMTRLLSDLGLSREAAHYIDTIRTCGATLLSLINDVLLFSKMEYERVSLDIQPFDVRKTIEEVRDLLSAAATEKGLVLSCRLDETLPQYLMGDDTRFRQVLTNLLSNAVKFTNQGSVVIEGAATRLEGKKYDVRLAVVDTGIGIDQEAQGKLFQAFYQVRDKRSVEREGGTGLGLAICKAICEAMGGTISVQSEVGRGTTFTVRFQAETVEASMMAPPVNLAQIEVDLGTRFPLRILLVEDNSTNQLVTVQFLAKLGYRADVAANGQEGVEMVARHPYDLILMDCHMPIMDGFEATRKVRQVSHGSTRPAIVALTASAFEDDRTKCLAAGMDDVLAKPIDLDMLQRVLAKWGATVSGKQPAQDQPKPSQPDRLSASAVSEGPIEAAELLEGFSGMERILAKGIESFMTNTPQLLSRIHEALDTKDGAKLAAAAHALSGTTSMFRAAALAGFLRDLERHGHEGQMDLAADLVRVIDVEVDRAFRQLALIKVQCQTIASEHPVNR